MQRPRPVLAIALIEFAGCGLLLGTTAAAFVFVRMAAGPGAGGPPPGAGAAIVAGTAVNLLPAAWGILTGIGLLRMRVWALASTLVFAGPLLLAAVGLGYFALEVPLVVRSAVAEAAVRLSLGTVALAGTALGVWWLMYCSRRSVRARFSAPGGWGRRPFSISVLGWLGAAGGCLCLLEALPSPSPTVFFWPAPGGGAGTIYLAVGLMTLAWGVGLLRLHPWARTAALALVALGVLNILALWALPSGLPRFMASVSAPGHPFSSTATQPILFFMLLVSSVAGIVLGLLGLYFLWTRRTPFRDGLVAR